MQAPMYVLTQDIQPGMLVEVDGTRVDVDAVLVDYPGVHLVQGRSGALVARYGAEARVVRVNAHPAARPAESVTYAEPRFPAVAEASDRTVAYVDAVEAAMTRADVTPESLGATRTCTECGTHKSLMTTEERAAHRILHGYVVVGCEGYHLVDPALVGLDRGNWQDWRAEVCEDCEQPTALHCPTCAEHPLSAGPCYCGERLYDAPQRTVSPAPATGGLVLLPRADGTSGTIEADAVRALVGYVEQRDGHADAVDGCGDRECTCHIPAQSVWTPSTPDERRHTEVGRLVERTMRERPGLRYAVAYGNLSGLTLNAPEGWAAEFVRRLDAALADERKR